MYQPSASRAAAQAKWFYRYLSIVYDHIVNPGHWTIPMRDEALTPAQLDSPDLKVPPAPLAVFEGHRGQAVPRRM